MEKLESLVRQVSEAIMQSEPVEEILAKSLADYVAVTQSISSVSLDTADWVTSSIDKIIAQYPSMFSQELLRRALDYNISSLSRISGSGLNEDLLLEANFRTKAGNIAEKLLEYGCEKGFEEKMQLNEIVQDNFYKTGLIYSQNHSFPDYAESAFAAFVKAGDYAIHMAEEFKKQGSDPHKMFGKFKMQKKSIVKYQQAFSAYQHAMEICPFDECHKASIAFEAARVADALSADLRQPKYREAALIYYSGFLSYYKRNPSMEWHSLSIHAQKRTDALKFLGSLA